jgi:hypothetical protein
MNVHNPRVAAAALCLVFTVGVPAARSNVRPNRPRTRSEQTQGAVPGAGAVDPLPPSRSATTHAPRLPSLERDRDGSHRPSITPPTRG